MSLRKPPKNIGLLYDWHAQQRHQTVVHVDRPMDIAPDLGTAFDANQLATLVADTSAWLAAAGASYGSRVGIVKDNHLDMQILAAATARIGGLPATISALNRTDDIVIMLRKLDPAVIVLTANVFENISRVETTRCPRARASSWASPPSTPRTSRRSSSPISPGSDATGEHPPDDQPMMVTHTSGTTNTPKLVVHTANTNQAGTRVEVPPHPRGREPTPDTVLSSVSFAHSRCYAWMAAQLSLGAEEPGRRR